MQAAVEIEGNLLNSGINGVLLRNCSMASGETAASQNYIQNFRKNRKVLFKNFEEKEIRAAFKSRMEDSLYAITDSEDGDYFDIWIKIQGNLEPYKPFKEPIKKVHDEIRFSCDYAKINIFHGMDCILVCAFGVLIAFSEYDYKMEIIDTNGISKGKYITGICAFANRMVATFKNEDEYLYSGIAQPNFDMANGAGFMYSEYGNDMTQAVKRTGSRLAVFTTRTIEIKDLSQDPQMPFQGYLYQNNYDIGAIIETIREIDGVLYFVGEAMSGNRFICSLSDGVLEKLTNEAQSKLLEGKFSKSGVLYENGRVFYLAYGQHNFSIDVLSRSLFEVENDLIFLDYLKMGSFILRACESGFYSVEPGSDPYVAGKIRLPKYDFGSAANIRKISFVGEFLESSKAVATLTAERGFAQKTESHKRGFDFFLLGLQKLNDLEFSVSSNFRMTKIVIDYQRLENGSFYGVG